MAANDMKVNPNAVLNVPLSDIFVDPSWNVRSGIGEASGGEETENSLEGLIASISLRGQDEAVHLRPNPGKTKHPYALVTGFRRYRAITEVAEKTGNKQPTIKAVVRNMTEEEARELNVRENTARDSLSGPDLAFGLREMFGPDPANPRLTDSAAAQVLGLHQTYVSKLHRIVSKVSPKILENWRDRVGLKPTVDQIATLAKIESKSDQAQAYEEMVRGKEEGGGARGKNAWVETGKKKAFDVGQFLGALSREGCIEVMEDTFYTALDAYMKVHKDATDKHRASFSDALSKGFEKGLEEPEEKEEKVKAEKPKAEAKGEKKGAKNGATKTANAN